MKQSMSSALHWMTASSAYDICDRVIFDDSGNEEYREWLRYSFPNFKVIPISDTPFQGYSYVMSFIWDWIRQHPYLDYIFHQEEDFTFTNSIPMQDMTLALDELPDTLAQIVLQRQPWFANEKKYGGVIESLQAQGQQFRETKTAINGIPLVLHRSGFFTNPSLFPTWITQTERPTGQWSEMRFGKELLSNPLLNVAYYGTIQSSPLCIHIGSDKLGTSV